MKRFTAGAVALATAATMTLVAAPTATADAGDGTITLTVVKDVNVSSVRDAVDTPLSGVAVRISDASGHTVSRTTNASGQVVLGAADAGNALVGGKYRIEVINPNTTLYSEAYVLDGHEEPQFAPATSFVDVTGGTAAAVSVGYVDLSTLGPDNAMIYSAVQLNSIWPSGESKGVYAVPYGLDAAPRAVTSPEAVGTTYGVGLDSVGMNLYLGAYAKRGSAYGPGGPGAIYRVNPSTGATEIYATVADAGTTAHDMTETNADGDQLQDYSFRTAVGRESLGDVEVTDDGRFLLATNLHTDSVVVYPVQDGVNPAPVQTLAIPPVDCTSDWAPMALTEHNGRIYVGATCGATGRTSIIEYDLSAAGILSPTGLVVSGDPATAPGREAGVIGPDWGFPVEECRYVTWNAWSDSIPQACNDAPASFTPYALAGLAKQYSYPQPMLSDIEFLENGQIVLSYRDRGGDLYGPGLYHGESTDGRPAYTNYVAEGEIAAVCVNGATLDFTCRTDFSDKGGNHNEASIGGMVYVPGADRLVVNQMDATALNTAGLRAFDPETGAVAASSTGAGNTLVTTSFLKGQGLADMEALVLQASQQIGNRIWLDTDEDGIQDPGEPVVAGVQVSLYDASGTLIATTETDANGEYWFDTADGLLPATDYQIRLDRAADFEAGGPLAGTTPTGTAAGANRGIDSNGATADVGGTSMVVANVTSPAANRNDHSFDFGFVPTPVSIGDYVWIDADNDGQQDAGEAPVAGATVRLLGADGTEIATTTTDADGYYAFTDLRGSTDYTVVFPTTVTVDGRTYALTEPSRGAGATDSNPATATGEAPVRTPASGGNSGEPGEADDPTIDAGYVPLVSVGDYIWVDEDGDGVQDDGEAPVPGATVRLLTPEGDEVATTTTDENGYYVFTDLPGSTDYVIEFPTTVDIDGTTVTLTEPGAGRDSSADSNPAVDTGRAPITTPAEGGNSAEPGQADDPTIDAGYIVPPVSIGDYVWLDADRDGQQDDGEAPVPGATVRLLTPEGEEVATTTTDEDGYYAFTDLAPGTEYVVEFPTTVTVEGVNYVLTTPVQGEAATDSNPAADTGRAPVTTPLNGENSGEPGQADDPTIDAGYVPVLVSVGDYVWIDADGDGQQDDGEAPVPGATVRLLTPEGEEVATTTTDENGYYVFTDLPNSTDYVIEFPTTVTVGDDLYRLTAPGAGDDGAADSNPAVATGRAPVTTPADGENSAEPGQADDPTIDAGFVLQPEPILVSVGDYVWFDKDRDGVQDPGEKPIGGVTVKLFDENGDVVATTKTDENGYYAFTDLQPSTQYTIEFPKSVTVDGSTVPLTTANSGDDALDSDADPGTGRITFVTPASGLNSAEPGKADLPTLDAGYAPLQLAATGGALPWTLGTIAALLLVIGTGLMLVRRRRAASVAEAAGTAGSLLQ